MTTLYKLLQSDLRIVGVSIKVGDVVYAMGRPKRHHDILRWLHADGVKRNSADQGFLTSRGEHIDRQTAKLLALANGQYLTDVQYALRHYPNAPFDGGWGRYKGPDLFSEDLW
jgi:hypothetical protein